MAEKGHWDVLKLHVLLGAKSDPNHPTATEGCSPLFMAAQFDCFDNCAMWNCFLRQCKADIEQRCADGTTPLSRSVKTQTLNKGKADVNAANGTFGPPLVLAEQYAASINENGTVDRNQDAVSDMINELIKAGASRANESNEYFK